ncbi:MAG: hypothetical protein LBN09_03360 [Clostridioides sp.]|jgi:hypothetical protein|nr:hypothetical protein [Clostridioides sp.]
MKKIAIKLERAKFNFKFKQYEGLYFTAEIDDSSEIIKYKITEDEAGNQLKEFGNTHVREGLLYIPQVEAYIDLNNI